MATVKVKFVPSTVQGKKGYICYQVSHRQVTRRIKTGYRIHADEWDKEKSAIRLAPAGKEMQTSHLATIQEEIDKGVKRLKWIVCEELRGENFTADDIVRKYEESPNEHSFTRFMGETIAQLQRLGKVRTAENYTAAFNSYMRFRQGKDVFLYEIGPDMMMEYEAYLKQNGAVMNTISFYNRILRAVYNRAVEKGLVEQCHPFKHVYTGIDRTIKRALPLEGIRRIKALDLSARPNLDLARDMFLFSFYTRGMSFIDMAFLKKDNLRNGMLSYRRKKTNRQLLIRWEQTMQEIINKYDTRGTAYLLPIIRGTGKEQLLYRNAQRLMNNKLKEISVLAGLQTNLTMYVSRHSWASIAKSQNVPISVISDGMGHDSQSTTQIYLASLDNSMIDEANEQILKML